MTEMKQTKIYHSGTENSKLFVLADMIMFSCYITIDGLKTYTGSVSSLLFLN